MLCSKCQRTLPSDINAGILPPNSPLSHLMTTNDPPDKHQSDIIGDELARSRANLRSLDGEIAKARNHLLGLQAMRASAQIFVDKLASLHMRRLPTELLVRVFMLALPYHPSPRLSREAPVVLGKVSRLWRAVSRNTPRLWSTIDTEWIYDEKDRVAVVKWLERSHPCPLTVHAWKLGDNGLWWDMLANIAARIEHLEIRVKVNKLAQLFSIDGIQRLDALQSLHLQVTHHMRNPEFEEITQIDLGTRAPRLTNIRVGFKLTLEHLILPSIQITVCNLRLKDITSFTLFLQEAVNLVDCTVVVDSFNADVSPRFPVRHTTLEKLSIEVIRHRESDVLGSILPWLDLPSLREFKWGSHGYCDVDPINSTRDPLEWPITIFLNFLSRSGCTLSKLWTDSGPTEEDILRYLVEVPSVVDLAISPPSHRRPCELMQGLTLGSHSRLGGKDLVPNLERLRIRGAWCECEDMMQAIESRVSAVGDISEGRRLKRVSLAYALVHENRLGNIQERLDKCVREGLLYDSLSW
ncbi:hypothetical protein FIBSPDRAFT_1049650 [Athelia psychrophila]|uniref:Uncharacterized protein n=1 Tax=Athelia psychrophila TaxID=1759441 RepID=A0A166BXR5_9AGAM|nr:hypothetical protein FIBSPDRAFT_1049650 [Fibularhizoctonia sp. CBS 109695]